MTTLLTRRLGSAAFVCASIGLLACSSANEGSSPTASGGSGGSTGNGATGGSGGSTGGSGGATGGSTGTGATGGTTGTGATGGTGGAAGKAGSGGTAGSGGASGGSGGTGGAGTGGVGGTAGKAGAAGSGGAAGTTGGTGGVADAGANDGGGPTGGDASTTHFSFFVASQAAMIALSGNPKGFGGDLRFGEADGLTGADKICTQTAERGLPGNGKTWRAFLSVTKGPAGTPVNAIDRIGDGPWYDRQGRVFAMTKAALLQARPQGADAAIINDFPNETGASNRGPGLDDNHATLTGSGPQGTLWTTGIAATCQDWTDATATGGKPHVGYSFPRNTSNNWMSIFDEPGCLAGGTIIDTGGPNANDPSVGSSGGYGGIYCFALTP